MAEGLVLLSSSPRSGSASSPPPPGSLPPGVRLGAIPNIVPSDHGHGAEHAGFVDAVGAMEAPLERLVDRPARGGRGPSGRDPPGRRLHAVGCRRRELEGLARLVAFPHVRRLLMGVLPPGPPPAVACRRARPGLRCARRSDFVQKSIQCSSVVNLIVPFE